MTEVHTGVVRVRRWPDQVVAVALGAALAYGVVARGAFYRPDAAAVLLLLGLAAAARLAAPRAVARPVGAAAVALLAFAGWALADAAMHGDIAVGIPAAALAVGFATAAWTAGGLAPAAARLLRTVVLGGGLIVAISGWAGVALHVEPLALVSSGLWRAASTLTYANAAAAFLVLTLLLAAATLPTRTALPVVATLGIGLAATMSRAGLLALVAGSAVLALAPAHRARLAALWPVAPAVAIGFVGLLPALADGGAPRPLPALAGLAAGLAVLLGAGRGRTVLLGGVAAVAVTGLFLAPPPALTGIATTRLTAASAERTDLSAVTAAQFAVAPLTGVGPGRLDLVYVDHTGTLVRAEYTHDEYLQTAAETGVVGLALVLTAFSALAAAARRARALPAAALLAAFAAHSAFDFLWHIPVLPLVLVLGAVPLLSTPAPSNEEMP